MLKRAQTNNGNTAKAWFIFKMNPSPFKSLHCFWLASDCLSTQTVNISFLELTNNNAHFVLTCTIQKEHKEKWPSLQSLHFKNEKKRWSKSRWNSNLIKLQHTLWGGKCPLKFLAFKGEFKNSCVAQKPVISSLRCLLLTLCKNINKVVKAIMLRENNIFWQRIQVLLFKGLIFYKWQILNWLALRTLQQKYMERFLFSIQYVLFPLRQEQRWPQFSVHLMPQV